MLLIEFGVLEYKMCSVSEDTKTKIFATFGKTPKAVAQDVEIVKNWIETQPHLPEVMDGAKIQNFLLLNKFSVEKTKQKIDMYYTIRTLIPDFFELSNPKLPNFKEYFENTYMTFHPKLINDVHRVYLFQLKTPNTWSPWDTFRDFYNMYEIRLYEDCMVDDIILVDLAGVTLGDLRRLSPTLTSKFFGIYKKVYSLRMKWIIYFNSPPYVNILVSLLKAIMTPKIFERVRVANDAEILKEIFDRESLPSDYGGDGPSLKKMTDMIREKFVQYRERFDKLDTLKVDESLRPEKLDNDEILGFYGSFKKLELD